MACSFCSLINGVHLWQLPAWIKHVKNIRFQSYGLELNGYSALRFPPLLCFEMNFILFFFPILLSLSWVLHFYSNKGQQNCFSASESLTTSIIYMLQTKLLNGYNWDSCFWSKSPWNIHSSTAAAEKPWSEAHHKQK